MTHLKITDVEISEKKETEISLYTFCDDSGLVYTTIYGHCSENEVLIYEQKVRAMAPCPNEDEIRALQLEVLEKSKREKTRKYAKEIEVLDDQIRQLQALAAPEIAA